MTAPDRSQCAERTRDGSRDGRAEARSVGRSKGQINDITFNDDRPAPVLLPVAVLADGTLGAWDVYHGRATVMRHGRAGGLVIAGPDGNLEALRVR